MTESTASSEPTPSVKTEFPWRYWLKRLLVCNPFFLCSAALLLYAISKLSTDSSFLDDETQNLIFNFLALQAYEMVVIGGAIWLRRRRIWYDSALLVVVDHGLLLVPFMLICQGAWIGSLLGIGLSIIAMGAAISRMIAIQQKYPEFNLPRRAALCAAAFLVVNGSVPHWLRNLVEESYYNWEGPNLIAWYGVLPLLTAGANTLPKPRVYGGTNAQRHWLPMMVYGLWLAGTGVHLWSLGYICRIEFALQFLGPTLSVAAWTSWHNLEHFLPHPAPWVRKSFLSLTFLGPLAAIGESHLFVVLVAVNGLGYLMLAQRRKAPEAALAAEFAFLTPAMLIAGLPPAWTQVILPLAGREQWIGLGIAVYALCNAVRLIHPFAGLLGACAAAALICGVTRTDSFHCFAQITCAFVLVHSLRWTGEAALWRQLRLIILPIWISSAYLWVEQGKEVGLAWTSGIAGAVLLAWVGVLLTRRIMPNIGIALAAAVITLNPLVRWMWERSTAGLLALTASYILLAMGFIIAIKRGNHADRAQSLGGP